MTHINSTRSLRVPEGYDPRITLPQSLWKYAEPTAYFVHKVTVGPIYDARTRKERKGWHPVRWEDMNRLCGRSGEWSKVRRHCIESRVVECDEEYEPGVRAKRYRLGPEWITKDTESRPITDQKFARRLAEYEQTRNARGEQWQPVHDYLAANLRDLTIEEGAVRRLTTNRRSEKHRFNRMSIAALNGGEWRLTICPYGRVHTNITNMDRRLRKALRFRGTNPTEVDVSNAQPLLIWGNGRSNSNWKNHDTGNRDLRANLRRQGRERERNIKQRERREDKNPMSSHSTNVKQIELAYSAARVPFGIASGPEGLPRDL